MGSRASVAVGRTAPKHPANFTWLFRNHKNLEFKPLVFGKAAELALIFSHNLFFPP